MAVNHGTSTLQFATDLSFLTDGVSLNCQWVIGARPFRGETFGSPSGGGGHAGKHNTVDDFSEWKRSRVNGVVDFSGGGTDADSFLEMRWVSTIRISLFKLPVYY
jgi:hypothetical protein